MRSSIAVRSVDVVVRWWRFAIPLLVFLGLILALGLALRKGHDDTLPSALIGRPVPAFDLPVLGQAGSRFSPVQLQGRVWVLNVWASWCVSCREEHPALLAVARDADVPLLGFNYQDKVAPAQAWLQTHGDPYRLTVVDADGRVGMDLGVVGVPETFVIDRHGVVRYKLAGPLTTERWHTTVAPLVKELQGA